MLCANTFLCLFTSIFPLFTLPEHTLADTSSSTSTPHSKSDRPPNFLVIVADDLGWSDVSPFGGEIHTPNIELLANSGTRFTDFHTASACSPSRSMLMSGTDNHIAGLGQMVETIANHPEIWQGKVGYEGYLNERVAALPEIMQDAGYFTTMSGKWHLGMTNDQFPASRGFDDSFSLLSGGDNHYAYQVGIPFLLPVYVRNSKFIDPATLENFYSSDYFATQLIESLKSNAEMNNKPFFAYLPFTAPHWPLHAPADIVAKYKGVYDSGPSVLREKRLEIQQKLGLLPPDIVSSPIYSDDKEWDQLTPNEQAYSAKAMEIYAAMVELMDFAISRVMDYLKQTDQFENTFILFMSDNGAEGVNMESIPLLSQPQWIPYFNNSYENMGNKDSLILYGPRWAQASSAPTRMSKGYITEGGIRCPAIVHYSKFQTPLNISHEFTTVMDILPTILELARIQHPGTTFRNRTVVIPRGKSWVSYLINSGDQMHHVHDKEDFTGWELFGQRAIRRGNYKAVLIPNKSNTAEWELYDLTHDKGEMINLAHEQKGILDELIEAWLEYETETGVIVAEDGWAVRYPPDIFESQNAQNTTPVIENMSTMTCLNSLLPTCILLFWLCHFF